MGDEFRTARDAPRNLDTLRKIGVQLSDWHVLSENRLVVSNFISSSQKGKLQKNAIFLMLNI